MGLVPDTTSAPVSAEGVKAVAFDLDGTLYLGDRLIPGADDAVAAVRHKGIGVLFITNASSQRDADIVRKLARLGVPAAMHEVLTSASATAGWLRANGPRRVAVLGTQGLVAELEASGLEIVADEDAEALVVGLDRDRDWNDASPVAPRLSDRISEGSVALVACTRELSYPGPMGTPMPGCGVLVAQVERQCRHAADVVIGKPEPYLLQLAAARSGMDAEHILVVGDSWSSDAAMARRCGSPWALVPAPGGIAAPEEASSASDGEVLASISELRRLLERPSPGTAGA
jgi:HAD superfamily hydrolase (TIGR01450 family)